jgi:hypothetical protein
VVGVASLARLSPDFPAVQAIRQGGVPGRSLMLKVLPGVWVLLQPRIGVVDSFEEALSAIHLQGLVEDGLHGDAFLRRQLPKELAGVVADADSGAVHMLFLMLLYFFINYIIYYIVMYNVYFTGFLSSVVYQAVYLNTTDN